LLQVFLVAIAYFVAGYYVDNKDKELKKEVLDKIDKVFDGNSTISDGENQSVKMEQIEIPSDGTLIWNDDTLVVNKEYKDLFSFYKCVSGGFKIIKATRESENKIDVRTIYSTNMGYKVKNFNYYVPGFNESYKSAYDYLTIEDKSSGFTPGKFKQIEDLYRIHNEYYKLDDFEGNYRSIDDGHIFNFYWKVFYSYTGDVYYLQLDNSAKRKDFWKFFGFSTLGILLLSFVIFYKPKEKENNSENRVAEN
jgi:hypothetical protein